MMAINSHIHVLYCQENAVASRPDIWEEGVLETTFWRVSDHITLYTDRISINSYLVC